MEKLNNLGFFNFKVLQNFTYRSNKLK